MLLSVIIPMYNAENYIRRCVESLYQQNIIDSDFEVIIINDGSINNVNATTTIKGRTTVNGTFKNKNGTINIDDRSTFRQFDEVNGRFGS